MDSLEEASPSDLAAYLNHFEAIGPKGAAAACTVKTQNEFNSKGLKSYFKFYKPFGMIKNGLVAVNAIPNVPVNISLYPLEGNKYVFEEALAKTKRIDWSRSVWMAAVTMELRTALHNVARRLDREINIEARFVGTILPKHSEQFDVKCPDDLFVGKLGPENASLVNASWIYLDHPSEEYFSYLNTSGKSLAFFTKTDKKPVSWIIVNEYGNPDFLYTIEEYRNRGLAQVLCKFLYNEMLMEGKDIIGYAELKDNFKPLQVQLNLNSEIFGLFYFMEFVPKRVTSSKL